MKKKFSERIAIMLLFISFSMSLKAQLFTNRNLLFEDKIYAQNIKTLQASRADWDMAYPIIKLNSDEKIKISFDLLGENFVDFSYTLIHCDANWNPSDLLFSEYCSGFEVNTLNEFYFSINTFAKYIHYQVQMPNDDVSPLISGNYLFVVFEQDNPERLILSKRLYFVDSKVKMSTTIKRSVTNNLQIAGQRIDFNLFKTDASVASENIQVAVFQNGRNDNSKKHLQPKFLSGNELIFQDELANVFDAGNEFRHLDMKSERFQPMGVEQIYYEKPYYHFKLDTDFARNAGKYQTKRDLNGEFFIKREESDESYRNADYFYAHFRLNTPNELLGGDVFIVGAFSNWNLLPENRMFYNLEAKNYEATLFLKQGYYNYAYVFKNTKTRAWDFNFFEGNFSETENKYLIFVYDVNPLNNYHQLIGYKVFTNYQD